MRVCLSKDEASADQCIPTDAARVCGRCFCARGVATGLEPRLAWSAHPCSSAWRIIRMLDIPPKDIRGSAPSRDLQFRMVGVETRIAPACDAGLALKNSELEWLLRGANGVRCDGARELES
jgi:hypothetical protein